MIVENISALFLSASESKDYSELIDALLVADVSEDSAGIIKAVKEGSSVIFDDIELSPMSLKLAFTIASFGVENDAVVNFVKGATETVFAKFPDQALLETVLNAPGLKGCETIARFESALLIFRADIDKAYAKALTVKKLPCYNPSQGFGLVTGADIEGKTVSCEFKIKQNMPLQIFLDKCFVVRPGSLLYTILTEKKYDVQMHTAAELLARVGKDFVPAEKMVQATLTRLLMPKFFKTAKAFQTWSSRRTARTTNASGQEKKRDLTNVRSLAEFKVTAAAIEVIKPNEAEVENLKKIFAFAAPKPLQADDFTECFVTLNDKCKEHDLVAEIVKSTADTATVWQSADSFFASSDALTVKKLASWIDVTYLAKGADWLSEAILTMPLKYYSPTASVLKDEEGNCDALYRACANHVKSGDTPAGALNWLWQEYKKDQERIQDILGSAPLIFRAIARSVSGSFIKGTKDLKNLLLEDDDFLMFLMNNGEETAVRSLVSSTRTLPGLESGEKQSLLIRITRVCPDAKEFVEVRTAVVQSSKLEEVTSVRMYEVRKEELADIISKKIPENTEAISTALEFGDLKENSEFKYAKEQQRFLQARRAELEQGLDSIRPTDFSEVEVDGRAIPGSEVVVKVGRTKEVYTILGIWDSVPEEKYISFETPMGELLVGLEVGDEFEMPNGKNAKVVEVRALSDSAVAWVSGK